MVKRKIGGWKFNEEIARDFQTIAHTNIPNYEAVIARCVEIVSWELPDKNSRIIDVGSALGYTMKKLRDAGYVNVWGVENSAAMLKHSKVRENLIHSDVFPKKIGLFDTVIANWTLHFIPKKPRRTYLKDIYNYMHKDGILIISEKMMGSNISQHGYLDFKRSRGLSEKTIAQKADMLEDVLLPLPVQWYFKTLSEVGFCQIEIIDALWCFNTILCRK